jgi:serine/threonine-protein kinase
MMSRSGGFNVPADYFRNKAAMPTPLPMTPIARFKRSRLGAYFLAGTLAMVATAAVILAVRDRGTPTVTASSADTVAATSTSTAPPATAGGAASPVAEMKEVIVNVEPKDAKIINVTKGGEILGTSPVRVQVRVGEQTTIRIEAPKYLSREEHIDDSKPERTFKLRPSPIGPAAAKPAPSPTKPTTTAPPTSSKSMGEFQDPWKKK